MTISAFPLARRSALALAVAAIPIFAPGASATEREHGVHVHGLGHLNIAIEGNSVEIELEAPGADIVGFEHAPRNPAERAAVAKAIEKLKDGAELFIFPDAAGCRLAASDARSTSERHDAKAHGAKEAGHGHDGDKAEHSDTHSEFRAHYRFACDRGDALTGMEARLFDAFPAAREFAVQAITGRGQTSGELTRDAPRLKF